MVYYVLYTIKKKLSVRKIRLELYNAKEREHYGALLFSMRPSVCLVWLSHRLLFSRHRRSHTKHSCGEEGFWVVKHGVRAVFA